MAEHVGRAQLPEYADTLHALLGPAAGCSTTRSPARPGRPTSRRAPTLHRPLRLPRRRTRAGRRPPCRLEEAGFEVRDVEALREHYALTCGINSGRVENGPGHPQGPRRDPVRHRRAHAGRGRRADRRRRGRRAPGRRQPRLPPRRPRRPHPAHLGTGRADHPTRHPRTRPPRLVPARCRSAWTPDPPEVSAAGGSGRGGRRRWRCSRPRRAGGRRAAGARSGRGRPDRRRPARTRSGWPPRRRRPCRRRSRW